MPTSNVISISRGAGASKPSPREAATTHLEAALATGVRGELRDAIRAAIGIATAPRKRDLTELHYESLKPGQKLLDGTRPGFLARTTRRGTRFVYRHRDPETDRQVEAPIGYLSEISLADARAEWEKMRARRLEGETPAASRRAQAAAMLTMGELGTKYIDEYACEVKRSWKDDERLLKRHILPEYSDLPADQFTTEQARTLFKSLSETPRERDKLRAMLSTMFNVAVGRTKKIDIDKTWLPNDLANPITNAVTAEHKPDVNLPETEEARQYHRALNAAHDAAERGEPGIKQNYADVLLLQLLTASRIREVTDMEWSEVNFQSGKWTLPKERSKNGEQHVVLLSTQAMALLERRHEWKAPRDKFVFPSERRPQTQPVRADLVSNALAKNREALGVGPRFTSHNVRHMFSTWAGEKEVHVDVVNRCTAHVIGTGINRHYNAAKLNRPAAELWQAWADYLV